MTEPDRAERALQAALAQLDPPEPPDPRVAQRRVRDRRVAAGAVAVAMVVIALIGGGVALRPHDVTATGGSAAPASGSTSATLPRDPAPKGWRTEYYRTASFDVPDTWGYAYEPTDEWCATNPTDQPAGDQAKPYVALGYAEINWNVRCGGPRPASLTTEHVQVATLSPAANYAAYTESRIGGWWVVTSVHEVKLTVTSHDLGLARRIAKSLATTPATAPCDPDSPVTRSDTVRPDPRFDLAEVTGVGAAVICQYDGPDRNGSAGLRAVVRMTPDQAQTLIEQVRQAPIRAATPCERPGDPAIRVAIRFEADETVRELFLRAGSCATGRGGWGGFDDGTNVRALTRAGCHAVLRAPARLDAASGDPVGSACLG